MEKFFKPKSVVVVGVSESPKNLSRSIIENLLEFKYNGIIYQVGRAEGNLHGRKIYKSVLDISDPIELAVILIPAPTIPAILEECGKKGIRHAVIESAGFREYGEAGKLLENDIIRVAEKYKICFIGPNCIGPMDVYSGLATSFVTLKDKFKRGNISVITQSGGVGFSYLTIFESENLGIAKFASIGNKLNVNENDLLEYLIEDEETKIICMYLEGISDGRRFMELAKGSKKPILVHKANIGTQAKAIAASHTASVSSDDDVVSAALKQCGIMRVKEKEGLVNTLKIVPLPPLKGNRLAIVSRSGGHAIIAADLSETEGFELAPLSDDLKKEIEGHLRGGIIRITNPVDLGDIFDFDMYAKIVERLMQQDNVDGVVFMHTFVSASEGEKTKILVGRIEEYVKKYDKPVGVCVAANEHEFNRLKKDLPFPIFAVPSATMRAMARSRDFWWRQCEKRHSIPERDVTIPKDAEKNVKNILTACKKAKRSPLLMEGMDIFDAYGIPVVRGFLAKNEKEAVQAARKMNCRVAMKVVSGEISHKTDLGGVRLNLKHDDQIKEAFGEMMEELKTKAPNAKIEGVFIQPMLKHGRELILGAKQDQNFGSVVLAGMGGILVEVMKDVSMRVCPFDHIEAHEMLTELKGYPILAGVRGQRTLDIDRVEDALLKLCRLVTDFPEIKEIDINPFYVLEEGSGAYAVDARIIL